MLTLNELKSPYETLVKVNKIDLKSIEPQDIVDKYYEDEEHRDLYISILVCKSWNSLQSLYYKHNEFKLSAEECYDIFIQTLYYVVKSRAWKKEDSTLFEDENAFLKAMNVTIGCRKKNYVHAQHRQKRVANYNSLSLDGVSEECSEGYFTPYEDNVCLEENNINNTITFYFKKKDYITAFILESIINFNVFTIDNDLDIRKLRKYLRHLDLDFCHLFSKKYKLNEKEVIHSLTYFKELPQNKLDENIEKSFTKLRKNDIIKKVVKQC